MAYFGKFHLNCATMAPMSNFIVRPQTLRLSELFAGDVTFQVPPFQRNYSWKTEHWEDMWTDLKAIGDKSEEHYMGYIVLQEDKEHTRVRRIIDGQQRLVTLSLFIMAGAQCLRGDKQKADLMTRYLTTKKIGAVAPVSRLKLNRKNHDFYNGMLREKNTATNKDEQSNKQMLKALDFFKAAIADEFRGASKNKKIIDFIDQKIAELVVFTVLMVDDDDKAFTVFETLNARGVELSSPDLLKNHLFTVASGKSEGDNLEQIENTWDRISGKLRSSEIAAFLRHHWMSRTGEVVRQKQLYRDIRTDLKEPGQVFPFLDEMEEAANLYADIRNPESGEWGEEAKRHLKVLASHGTTQHIPLLMAAHKHWGEGREFIRLVRYCSVVAFRRFICKNSTNILERVFAMGTKGVTQEKIKTTRELLPLLEDLYPSDETFRANFADFEFPSGSAQLAKLVMLALKDGRPDPDDDTNYTLEHVLPENPNGNWPEFSAHEHKKSLWRIGNLALLSHKDNRDAGNKSFSEKKKILRKCPLDITKECAEHSKWKTGISTRQRQLAKKACGIWKFDLLD